MILLAQNGKAPTCVQKRNDIKPERLLHVLINEMQIPRVYLQSGNRLDLCNDTVKINKKDLLDNLGEIH